MASKMADAGQLPLKSRSEEISNIRELRSTQFLPPGSMNCFGSCSVTWEANLGRQPLCNIGLFGARVSALGSKTGRYKYEWKKKSCIFSAQEKVPGALWRNVRLLKILPKMVQFCQVIVLNELQWPLLFRSCWKSVNPWLCVLEVPYILMAGQIDLTVGLGISSRLNDVTAAFHHCVRTQTFLRLETPILSYILLRYIHLLPPFYV